LNTSRSRSGLQLRAGFFVCGRRATSFQPRWKTTIYLLRDIGTPRSGSLGI